MKSGLTGWPLLMWAAAEIMRRPGRHLLLTTCLATMIAVTATAVLFSQALDATWRQLLDQSPDLVIRRIDGGGWRPLPAQAAVKAAGGVPGALDPTPRVWGVAAGPQGPVTVLAAPGAPLGDRLVRAAAAPGPGQAVVGRWVSDGLTGHRLTLVGQTTATVTVIGTFPPDSTMATDDLVWLAMDDARALLGLADGEASDLAVYLFREEEQQAIQTDLAAAFPWPVQITDRATAAWRHHRLAMRTGSVALTACVPSLLALLLLVTGTLGGNGRQAQWGLFKALGWTTHDLVKLRLAEATIVAVPAGAVGLGAAYMAVFFPPAAGLTALWFLGGRHVPDLVLSGSGILLTMLVITALAVLPYVAAVFLATLRETAHDPFHLLQADPWK